jgi:hypothetical protein
MNAFEKAIREWLSQAENRGKIIDTSLLVEMMEYADTVERHRIGVKALRVYCKCMRTGRIKMAREIEKRYERDFPKTDLVVALTYVFNNYKKEDK